MRNLLFKNLTSADKKRKIIASTEVMDKKGVHSVIHRHFVCLVREGNAKENAPSAPTLFVLKEHNHKEQKERFFCKIKGSMAVINQGKIFTLYYLHSLQICLVNQPMKAGEQVSN